MKQARGIRGFITTNRYMALNLFKQKIILFLVFFTLLSAEALADDVILKNGRKLQGLIKKEDNDTVEVEVAYGTVKLERTQIANVVRSNSQQVELIKQDWQTKKSQAANIPSGARESEVAVRKIGNHIAVNTQLNDSYRALLLMDTGSSFVVLKYSVAVSSGINPELLTNVVQLQVGDGRTINAKRGLLKTLKVGDIEERNVEIAILPANVTDPGLLDGLLGMTFLGRFKFQVDYVKGKLVIERH